LLIFGLVACFTGLAESLLYGWLKGLSIILAILLVAFIAALQDYAKDK